MTRLVTAAALAAVVVCWSAAASAPRGGPAAHAAVRGAVASGMGPVAGVQALTAWCGAEAQTDRVPNAVAGDPVHWVYVIPSDAPDDLSTVAITMQSDAEQVDSWWRGQDPDRTPRNDVAPFPCGTQLDITTVRSTLSSPLLASTAARFERIVDSVQQAGLTSSLTKYVVYYDGPVDDDNICGQGGSDGGFGVAVVYYRACAGVSTAAVYAHEFLHTIGAVPSAAPNDCPGENSGHTCDDASDIMYPAIGGAPLSVKVLDPGRNDYYGHPGSWLDTRDSAWLVRLDNQAPLGLTVSGTGTVTADVPGLLCSATCTTTWNAGQALGLSATPGTGMKLVRWGGACTGSAGCSVTVNPGTRVSALFAPARFRLAVSVAGRGSVRSSGSAIACPRKCSASVPSYTPVRIAAAPAKGWKFRAWSGACRGSKATCTVPMTAATTARARFVRR